ncbi:MAG TPA: hypothetical protein VFQ45_02790 [Longimicrobium sp.]|nr:hypothetical protein [Longimicrobium sp.]
MRKLMLESLQVETFATTERGVQPRGTVIAHGETCTCPAHPVSGVGHPVETYDPVECGETNYMDCTMMCSVACGETFDICWG